MDTTTVPDVEISSFSAPTEDDLAKLRALSTEECTALMHAHLDKSRASGMSGRTMDDLWQEALKRAGKLPDHGL